MRNLWFITMFLAAGLMGAGCDRGAKEQPKPDETKADEGAAKTDEGALLGGDVQPPKAEDLAEYTKDLTGSGPLMATIETTMGAFHCELFADKVPMTVANFVGLARGLKAWRHPGNGEVHMKPFYDGIIIHRVIPRFMVQTGDPLGQGVGGPGYSFDDEIRDELRHSAGGMLSMANAGPGTNGSQFFITEGATPHLDGRHTVFGQCKEVDLVKQITQVQRDDADRPLQEVKIERVVISRGS